MKYRLLRGRFNRIERGVLVRYLPDSGSNIVDLSEEEAKKLASLIGPVTSESTSPPTPSPVPTPVVPSKPVQVQPRMGRPVRN